MSGDQPIAKFAARRPDWELPQLQLEQLKLHPFDALEQATSRQPCPKCHKSRFLYCYDCAVAFTPTPSVALPFQVSIITHHAELASKNTGVMAAILCPQQVQLHSIEQLPACEPSRCAVLFPSDDALLPDQLDLGQLQRVVILDSKWAKAKELNEHPALHGMKRVRLPGSPKSCFWRFHTSGVSDDGVCTIEALHLLLRALAERLPDVQRDPHYFDNLLWYFAFQHQLVAKKAAERQQKKAQQQQQPVAQHQELSKQKQGGVGSQQQQPRYPQQPGKRCRKQKGGDEDRQQQQQHIEHNHKQLKQEQQKAEQQHVEKQQRQQQSSLPEGAQPIDHQQLAEQQGCSANGVQKQQELEPQEGTACIDEEQQGKRRRTEQEK